MEVCGGQTHAITKYGLMDILPKKIELIHGPGCPVCVTPKHIIDSAILMAKQRDIILCTFGDMMRVPGSFNDLLQEKAVEDAVVGNAQVEGCPVENGAAVSAGAVVEEAGVADYVVRFGIGAGEHPDGAAAPEIPLRCIVFEQATVDAHSGKTRVQGGGAGYVDGDGAAVVAGVVVAERTTDELGLDGGAHRGSDENGCSPAGGQQRAGIAFEQAVAGDSPYGSVAAALHSDPAAAGGVVVPEGATLDKRVADGSAGAVDVKPAAK